MLRHLRLYGEPITPGTGTVFVRYAGNDSWNVSWEALPDGIGGMGTQDEVREFLLKAAPTRILIVNERDDDYIDLDPLSHDWPRPKWTADGTDE